MAPHAISESSGMSVDHTPFNLSEALEYPITFDGPGLPVHSRSRTTSNANESVQSFPTGRLPPSNTPADVSTASEYTDLTHAVDSSRLETTLEVIEEHHNDAMSLAYSYRPNNPENTPFSSRPSSMYGHAPFNMPSIGEAMHGGEHNGASSLPSTPRAARSVVADVYDGEIRVTLGSPRPPAPMGVLRAGELGPLGGPVRLVDGPAVYEHQDWSVSVLEDVDRALARLENLALDDYQRNPSVAHAAHYRVRLRVALARPGRMNVWPEEEK